MDPFDPRHTALLADLHQVMQAAACWEHDRFEPATFELTLAALPPRYGYLIAAGADTATQYLLDLRFSPEQVNFLSRLFVFHNLRPGFWDYLRELTFHGDYWAVPEGTPVFPGEPLLRVTAPLPEAWLLGSYLRATVAFQSAVATATTRLVAAAGGKTVIDCGAAEAHGPGAGPLAARAAYIGGSAGSASLEAGNRLGIPIHGCMDHNFLAAFATSTDAWRAWHDVFPDAMSVALDPAAAEPSALALAGLGLSPRLLRLDGPGRDGEAAAVRAVFDRPGARAPRLASGRDLDEDTVAALTAAGVPIDTYLVGGALAAAPGASGLATSWDLVEMHGTGDTAGAAGRQLPGARQVYRKFAMDGLARADVVALASETQTGAPMLGRVIEAGKLVTGRFGLESLRDYCQSALARIPAEVRDRHRPATYPVSPSDELRARREAAGRSRGA